MRCVTYKCILIFIIIKCVYCADKPGDQPPVSNESDSDEEEDNFEVTETSEPSKTSEAVKHSKTSDKINFMKKNEEGIIVPMDEGEYKLIFEDSYRIKYIFKQNLEMILYDYKVIFNHRLGKPYPTLLMYYKVNKLFVLEHEYGFLFIKCERGELLSNAWNRSGHLKLYTKDSRGDDVLLDERDYNIGYTPEGFCRYMLKSSVKCYKIMLKDKLIWERKPRERFPSKINITLRKDIIVHFGDYYIIFVKKKGYKKSYKKAIIKSHRHK